MIRFKNNDGLSLIEVMIAMAIIALVFTPLFILQGNVLQRVAHLANKFKRIIIAENILYKARQEQLPNAKEFTKEQADNSPPTNYVYTLGPIAKESPLSSMIGLHSERVTMKWQENGKQRSDTLVTFIYKPEQAS